MTDKTASWPPNDTQFQEKTLKEVRAEGDGYAITDSDGWSLFIQSPDLVPEAGMAARYYGAGIGSPVRGLFLDGHQIFYWTPDDYQQKEYVERYGASAQELLDRWDAGKSVWTIEMGGISPGYEQCIQLTGFEMMRVLLAKGVDLNTLKEDEVRPLYDEVSEATNWLSHHLGLSGAQHGAAWNMATVIVRHGPVKAMLMVTNDRRQQNRKFFPSLARETEAYALVRHLGRMDHPGDDGYVYPTEDDADHQALMGLVARSREIMSLPFEPLQSDVIDLVIAAREVMDTGPVGEEFTALDKALEAFASRVPYENEPQG